MLIAHQTDLLVTKVHAPVIHSKIVRRQRLTERLRGGMNSKLTLIVAPAGYGKSTLLREWLSAIETLEWPVAWLSLDKEDNRPFQFWAYVVGALRTIDADLQRDLVVGLGESSEAIDCKQLNPLINRLAAIPKQISLVLDDYHEIANPSIHQSLSYFIEHAPENVHMVIASRVTPPIPLARLRVLRQLVEIQNTDLCFDINETETFLRSVMDLDVAADDVTTLVDLTEGWIAGLQLAALSLQSGQDPKRFLADFAGSHRNILDYLSEEVLNRQDASIKEFMVKTSILGKMSAPLCDALLGTKNSEAVLSFIEQANLFIIPLDEHRYWYRYHTLFADSLNIYLKRTYPELVPELHRKAGNWLIENGYPEQAVPHALASGNHELAADIVESCAFKAITRFDLMMVIQWISRLPPEVFRQRPQLGVFYALANLHLGRVKEVERQLEELKMIFEGNGHPEDLTEEKARLYSQVLAIRAATACIQADYDRGIKISRQAMARLQPEDYFLTGMIEHHVSYAYLAKGRLSEAIAVLHYAIQIANRNDFHREYVCSSLALARVYKHQGLLQEAAETYHDALDYAADKGLEQELISFLQAGLGEILHEWNRLKEADRLLQEAQNYCSRFGTGYLAWHYSSDLFLIFARNHFSHKDYQGAMEALLTLQDNLQRYHVVPFLADRAEALQVHLWLTQDERKKAEDWAANTLARHACAAGSVSRIVLNALARVLIAQENYAQAVSILSDSMESVEAAVPLHYIIEARCLLALASNRLGKAPEAVRALLSALELGEPGGYARIFVDEGSSMKELLTHALYTCNQQSTHLEDQLPSVHYIKGLLAWFDTGPSPRPEPRPEPVVLHPLLEPLSDREMQVLLMLADGFSSKYVAKNLVISVNTARSHIKNIYQKLDVHNREDAVKQAIELGLLLTLSAFPSHHPYIFQPLTYQNNVEFTHA